MWIAKNNDLIILAKDTEEELEQSLQFMVYTDIEETDINYELYNGEYLTPEEIAQKKQEEVAMLSLTKREVFLALLDDKGITPEQLRSQITDARALIEFDYANDYFRGNPLIDSIGAMLGYTSEQLDNLFIYKTFDPPEPEPEPTPEPTEEPEPTEDPEPEPTEELEEGAEE